MNSYMKRTATENGGRPDELGLPSTFRSMEDLRPNVLHFFQIGKPEKLMHQLMDTVKKKEIEIESFCKLHYEDFILAVDELRGILIDSDEIKNTLLNQNLRLQDVSNSLLTKIDELLEFHTVNENLNEAIKMSKLCVQVINLCVKCNKHITESQFYSALKLMDLIEINYLNIIPLKVLKRMIKRQISRIKVHIEKQVCSDFKDWLVHTRESEKQIGQQTISKTASLRERDKEMRANLRYAELQSRLGSTTFVHDLSIEEIDENVDMKIDLSPVNKALSIHTSLKIEDHFREFYYKNRFLQLKSYLHISSRKSFLESYQYYFAQIVGYFIVENQVLYNVRELLSASQLDKVWNNALVHMISILEDQFSQMQIASDHLLVKDWVTLFGDTLELYGYNVKPIFEVLEKNQDKYHELLLENCRNQAVDILANDKFEQMVMKEEEYKKNVLSYYLQTSDLMPVFPYIAPFSSTVPEFCLMVQTFIQDSVNYLSYKGNMDFYDTVRKYLDKLLITVLSESLLKAIYSSNIGVSQAMQIAANVCILERACDFFLRTSAHLCGLSLSLEEHPQGNLTAKAVLKTSQNAAYSALLKLANSKLDEIITLKDNINWMADEIPQNQNEYVNVVIIYIETLLSTAQQILPMDALYKVGKSMLEHVSDSIVEAFLSDTVKRFNTNSVVGLDTDLRKLEMFADDIFHSIGLSELLVDGNFRKCLLEARQLINLLLSNQPENFMDPVTRGKNYSTLDHKKVAIICEKFKDSSDRLFGSLSNRNSKDSARKKSLDMLKRRLRDTN